MNDIEELSPEEIAFQCDGQTWRGQPLEPFSHTRRTAARALIRYFMGGQPEPVIVVWLSLMPIKKVKLARRAPWDVEDEIDAWAEHHAIMAIRNDELCADPETQRVYEQLLKDITASTAKPVSADDDTAEKKSGTGPVTQQIT